jgi:hypothetical protein
MFGLQQSRSHLERVSARQLEERLDPAELAQPPAAFFGILLASRSLPSTGVSSLDLAAHKARPFYVGRPRGFFVQPVGVRAVSFSIARLRLCRRWILRDEPESEVYRTLRAVVMPAAHNGQKCT